MATDTKKRKKRVDTPRSKPGVADTILWVQETFDEIGTIVNAAYLGSKTKKTLRQLTKAEVAELEGVKVDVLCACPLMQVMDTDFVMSVLTSKKTYSTDFKDELDAMGVDVREMSIDTYKKRLVGCYIEFIFTSDD